ncbi:hypothetical protein TNIN_289511 [Trichonephila inaurata madagascariensis]|uniref:Uncharacterized protein n=1 Tax=Trichonephila inaurata madagascariensis TaxID=2747483 RepID=A0A8X6IK89_9ARAC|nr:hypothetical protein TNIN_289511 [Trichonephila inaurata madagascariensis]
MDFISYLKATLRFEKHFHSNSLRQNFTKSIRHDVHHVSRGSRPNVRYPSRKQRQRGYENYPGSRKTRPEQYPSRGSILGKFHHSARRISRRPPSSVKSPGRPQWPSSYGTDSLRTRLKKYPSRGNLKSVRHVSGQIESHRPNPNFGLPHHGRGKYSTKFNIHKTEHHPQGPRVQTIHDPHTGRTKHIFHPSRGAQAMNWSYESRFEPHSRRRQKRDVELLYLYPNDEMFKQRLPFDYEEDDINHSETQGTSNEEEPMLICNFNTSQECPLHKIATCSHMMEQLTSYSSDKSKTSLHMTANALLVFFNCSFFDAFTKH